MHLNAGDLASVLESDLSSHGWNGAVSAYPGQPALQYAMAQLSKSLIKKFHNDQTDKERDAKALQLFTDVNSACGKFVLDYNQCSTHEVIALGEAKSFLYSFFFPGDGCGDQLLTFRKISECLGLGNGANLGAETETFYSKVCNGPLTGTSDDLVNLYDQAIFFYPLWASTESYRRSKLGVKVVQGSRLSFVPKSSEISRTICTEPVLNMLFQKGIANCLERRLSTFLGIDLSTQPDKNRRLCRLGSVTGKFGTIDLSSASDSMSNTLVREFFPPSVVRWFERTRSPVTTLPGGEVLDLHMVSSMGNAFTFPLQTLFFSALVYGAYRTLSLPFIRPSDRPRTVLGYDRPKPDQDGNFAVFGDDIIVLSEAYGLVSRLLAITGFKVNVDKSFNTGLFRESCGLDYYQGHNVRGVYIKKLVNAGDFYSAINRLNRWSARWNVALPRTISTLLEHCRFLPVPFDESDDAGVKVPLRLVKKRVFSPNTGGIRYTFWKMINPPLPVPTSDSVQPSRRLLRRAPSWFYNSDGILLSLLHGSIRDGSFLLRQNATGKAVLRQRYSSRWDYIIVDQFERPGFGDSWKGITAFNLLCEQGELP